MAVSGVCVDRDVQRMLLAAVTPVWSLAKAGPGAGSLETSKLEQAGLEQPVKAWTPPCVGHTLAERCWDSVSLAME